MFRSFTVFLMLIVSYTASAIHLDIAVSNDNGKIKTEFCSQGLACDDLPILASLGLDPQIAPIDVETGNNVFITDFNDFEGGPNAVDDPGFISDPGQLPSSLTLSYKALGQLMYWDPATSEWSNDVPGTTRIELFGGLEGSIIFDPAQCGGAPFCFIVGPSSTLFTESGIIGTDSLNVGTTDSSGVLHVHLDWFIEDGNDNPGGPAGAYMVEMQLTADTLADSDPFFIMFSKDITDAQFGQALAERINVPDTSQVPIPLPFSFLLMALVSLLGMRFKKS